MTLAYVPPLPAEYKGYNGWFSVGFFPPGMELRTDEMDLTAAFRQIDYWGTTELMFIPEDSMFLRQNPKTLINAPNQSPVVRGQLSSCGVNHIVLSQGL